MTGGGGEGELGPNGPSPAGRQVENQGLKRRRSKLPVLIPVLVLSILALVGVTHQLPYYALGPGPVRPVGDVIRVPADRAFSSRGQFLLMSVSIRDVTALEAVQGWLDPDVDVIKAKKVIGAPPSEQTRQQFEVKLERDMAFSRHVAVNVAFRRLGIGVAEPGGASPPAGPPFEVEIDTGETGGASGGLALTLGVLDALTSGDLTGGHRVAVSGSIFVTGHVGDIDGIAQKTAAARSAGARYLLVAPRNYDEAVAHAGGKLEVLKVANLDEAIAALGRIGGDLGPQRAPAPAPIP